MKVGILAGGFGTRLSEETAVKPKPMVEIGGQPILLHIMRIFASFGYKEFVIALGYKGEIIKDYFINYHYRAHSCTVSLASGDVTVHDGNGLDWTVHLLDTGISTQTGGRIKRIAEFVGNEPFMLTYGDGLSGIDISKLLAFHQNRKKLATVTAVRSPARFGSFLFENDMVTRFEEKSQLDEGWINGGFFVLEPEIASYIEGDHSVWEQEPMTQLVADGQLAAYQHSGFWQCMDTLRDVRYLNSLWDKGEIPWQNMD